MNNFGQNQTINFPLFVVFGNVIGNGNGQIKCNGQNSCNGKAGMKNRTP